MMDNMVWIYDIETFSNCFTYVAINRDTKEKKSFVIWGEINQFVDLINHLSECKGQIGFNNLNFDYPVLHYMIKGREKLAQMSADQVAKAIYKIAQKTIEALYSEIKAEEVVIPQLDLFRIWHYDNKARMTSLKKLEIAMNFPNVQDMPYHHTEKIKTKEQVENIINYNINDVEATFEFYKKTIKKLELRKGLLKKYGLNCINYPDSKIGEQLMLKLYCQATNQDENIVKRKRTFRSSFKFAECIPEYIDFKTDEFNQLLDYLKGIEVPVLKESFKYGFEYQGFTFDLGTGGVHGSCKPGIHKSTDDYTIIDADVGSLYPSLGITLNLYPAHLGSEFAQIYEDGIVKPRLYAKEKVDGKMRDEVMADGFKLSANSVYGKSNSEYSFLYDPLYTLKTTLAGQLALCLLSEMLMTRVPDLTMLQINTDGLTVIIPNEHKRLYWNICKEWEEKTKLGLEYVAYSQMIIRDVNNYIAVTQKDNKVKYKGTFKPNHEMLKDGEYHKSLSQGVVALAISDFFLKDIPVEETIKNHRNIYDFCKTFNASHGWVCETVDIDINGNESNIERQQKTNRYFLSKSGKRFRKFKDDKTIEIESNKSVVIFNKFEEKPFDEYNIDIDYYIDECYKIIHVIDGTTERLDQERREERDRIKKQKEEDNYLKFCVNKIPTSLQYEAYKRDWLIEKYGEPIEIKPSKINKK